MTRPLLLGHRGARASHHIPENTLASFELCLEHGCDGFEFDVRRSVDGAAVVCHDSVVREMEIAGTVGVDLALPSFKSVLQEFGSRAFLDIELKVSGLERETADLLSANQPGRGYVVSSFLPEVLETLHRLDATIPLGFIYDEPEQLERWRELPVEWVIPKLTLAGRALIEEIHAARKKAMLWTVNTYDELEKCSAWGADALISDETAAVAKTLTRC